MGKRLVIAHCLCPERARALRDMVLERCAFSDIAVTATRGLSSYYANAGGIIAAY